MSVGRKGGHCFEVRFDEAHCMGAAPAGWGAGNAAALLQHHHHRPHCPGESQPCLAASAGP